MVDEGSKRIGMENLRITKDAIEALQEVAEAFVVTDFECSNLLAIHAKRVTLMQEDMQLNDVLRKIHHGDMGNVSQKLFDLSFHHYLLVVVLWIGLAAINVE